MKKALMHSLEPGRICEVVENGSEFEVADTFYWIDCPDEVTQHYTYDEETKTFKELDLINADGFQSEGYKVARQIAYGTIGNQLDMIFKEIMSTGTISADGPWATLLASVKNDIPKDDPEAVMAWNIEYAKKH